MHAETLNSARIGACASTCKYTKILIGQDRAKTVVYVQAMQEQVQQVQHEQAQSLKQSINFNPRTVENIRN